MVKKANQVRIIAGQYRHRLIDFSPQTGLRPTPDSVRERVFNWLGQNLTGLQAADLFAGSGVWGFEALSRGAQSAVWVEKNRAACQSIRANAERLALRPHIVCAESLHFLGQSTETWDLVFLDPPYAWRQWPLLWVALQAHLNPDARVYIEAGEHIELPDYLEATKQGASGLSHYQLAQKKSCFQAA